MKKNEIVNIRTSRFKQLCIGGQLSILGLMFALALFLSGNAFAATEQTFDALTIGEHTYQNVKVTTKAKNYIFILHSGGMASFKVTELPQDVLQALGYVTAPKAQTNAAALWARQAVAKVAAPRLKGLELSLLQAWRGAFVSSTHLPVLRPGMIGLSALILGVAYLFGCYCCKFICEKSGIQPGILVWLPVAQLVPLLRAASMSLWWLIGLVVPVLNVVGYFIWCVKIVNARQKTMPLALLLFFPPTSLLALACLAFSEGAPAQNEKLQVEIMTLETA